MLAGRSAHCKVLSVGKHIWYWRVFGDTIAVFKTGPATSFFETLGAAEIKIDERRKGFCKEDE